MNKREVILSLGIGILISLLPIRTYAGEVEESQSSVTLSSEVAINENNFPDPIFRDYVSRYWDVDENGGLSESEISGCKRIDVSSSAISSLEGIEYFTSLQKLNCHGTYITSLDMSRNTALQELDCSRASLSNLDVSQCSKLRYLYLYNTNLSSLDVSGNQALQTLDCSGTSLRDLDVSRNSALVYLDFDDTYLSSLNVSKNVALTALSCKNTGLRSLDVSKNLALQKLWCSNSNLSSLDSNTRDLSRSRATEWLCTQICKRANTRDISHPRSV